MIFKNIEINNRTKQHVHRWTRVNELDNRRERIDNHKWLSEMFSYAFFENKYENCFSSISPLLQTLCQMKGREVNAVKQSEKKTKKKKTTLPWWCIFIAYGMSVMLILLSIVFILARGKSHVDINVMIQNCYLKLSFFLVGFQSTRFFHDTISANQNFYGRNSAN